MKNFFFLKNQNKILRLLFSVIVSSHLVIVGLSQLDENYFPPKIYKFIESYTGQIFVQKWSMFAPHPLARSLQFRYTCDDTGPWQVWLESLKKQNSAFSTITLQKRLFFYDSIVETVESEFLKSHKEESHFFDYSSEFFGLQISNLVAKELSLGCSGHLPMRAEMVTIDARTQQISDRIILWNQVRSNANL